VTGSVEAVGKPLLPLPRRQVVGMVVSAVVSSARTISWRATSGLI
jgi:hypothetical protein